MALIAKLLVVLPGEVVQARVAGVEGEQFDELLWRSHGERAKHQRVDEAEDGGVGADAEREREDGHGRETGSPAHHPEGVPGVLPERFHGALLTWSIILVY